MQHILWPFLLKMIIPRAYTSAVDTVRCILNNLSPQTFYFSRSARFFMLFLLYWHLQFSCFLHFLFCACYAHLLVLRYSALNLMILNDWFSCMMLLRYADALQNYADLDLLITIICLVIESSWWYSKSWGNCCSSIWCLISMLLFSTIWNSILHINSGAVCMLGSSFAQSFGEGAAGNSDSDSKHILYLNAYTLTS